MKKCRNLLIPFGLAAALAGCAAQPAYRPAAGSQSVGYSESKVSDNRYRVVYTGGPAMDSGTVQDYALLRSAELTLLQGYDWFQLANRDIKKKRIDSTDVDSLGMPQTQVYRSCGLLACSTTVVDSVGPGPGTLTTSSRTEYSSQLEITMGRNPQPASGDTFDARDVSDTLRESLLKNH